MYEKAGRGFGTEDREVSAVFQQNAVSRLSNTSYVPFQHRAREEAPVSLTVVSGVLRGLRGESSLTEMSDDAICKKVLDLSDLRISHRH